MTTYYVNYSTGSDSNNGTSTGTSFKRVAKAVSVANSGDIISLDTGNVHYLDSDADLIDIRRANVTLQGNGGMAIIDGRNTWPNPTTTPSAGLPYTTKAIVRVNANNVTVKNLHIRNSAGSGIDINTVENATLNGGLFEDLLIENLRWQAFGLGATNNATARRITCRKGGQYLTVTRSASVNNWPGMFAWKESANGVVEDITLSENWGEGMAYPNSPGTTIRRCKIFQCYSAHLYFNHAVDCLAEDIFIFHTGLSHLRGGTLPNGIAFNNERHARQAGWPSTKRITIRNAIVVGMGPNIFFGDQADQGFEDINIYNCTLIEAREIGRSYGSISFTGTPYTNVNIFNSIIYQTQGEWAIGVAGTGGGVRGHHNIWFGLSSAVPAALTGTGDKFLNPLLVANPPQIPTNLTPSVNNFKLRPNSPAINSGVAVAGHTNDYANTPISGLPDIGAFEYGTTTGTITAGFSLNVTSGEAPLVVTGTDTSVATSGITTYGWNWGDGTTSTTEDATHTYATPGVYTITHTVTGPDGTDTATQTITVNAVGTAVCFELLYRKCGESCIRVVPPPPGPGYVLISTDTDEGFDWTLLA